ncbi:MAG: hypothetical protein FJX76_06565 [Armatimonadetes bacterium]|nr:hypothetical protein [Armatimonadota bacterium]
MPRGGTKGAERAAERPGEASHPTSDGFQASEEDPDEVEGEFGGRQFHHRNAFESLDRNDDGELSTLEMGRLERLDSRVYDRDRDGVVDDAEFLAGRRAEVNAARRERVEERVEALEGDALERKLEKFDTDEDGTLTAGEVLEGRRKARGIREAERSEARYTALAGSGPLSVSANGAFRGYDSDGDGNVSKSEFDDGQALDRQRVREERFLDADGGTLARSRLGLDEAGRRGPSIAGKTNIGRLKDLTWESAVQIIRSRGGELFEKGQPAVLAVRTDNRGTTSYDDHFVVLKPNGKMKIFAATTRPGFTTPSGGWDPGMVLPGNYEITPRWRDGKFNNDAFIVGTDRGMTVPTAEDRNGDGRYSRAELANPVGSDEIRLHRGNAGSTSSAGCFNVSDYDGFLDFLGGRDATFNLTLVEA